MNGIFENSEEFFISDDPQEIEREKQRRQAIHALLPELAGGKKDTTIYVLRKDSTANNRYLQQGMSQETGQKKKIKVIDEGVRNRHLDEKRQYLRGY